MLSGGKIASQRKSCAKLLASDASAASLLIFNITQCLKENSKKS